MIAETCVAKQNKISRYPKQAKIQVDIKKEIGSSNSEEGLEKKEAESQKIIGTRSIPAGRFC